MDHVRRHRLLRCCVLAVPLLLLFALIAPPAGADADGYIDHFPGDVSFTPKIWNQTTAAYTPIPGQSVTVTGELKSDFDAAWNAIADPSQPSATFCQQLDTAIRAGDSDYVKMNHCNPTLGGPATELRAKMLGTNLLGLRYVIPGRDRPDSIYAYDHDAIITDENIDVKFDLTIDVAIRVAPGVGPETDDSTPLSVQSATLSFSRASFSASVCTDSCAEAEQKMNSTVQDITSQISLGSGDNEIHAKVASLPSYFGLSASVTPTAANFDLNLDVLPSLDPAKPTATVASTIHFGNLNISAQNIYGVDTTGSLWQQTSLFGLPYQHWTNRSRPSASALASGVAATVDANGTPNAWATGADGNLYQYNGSAWVSRGTPSGTKVVGTPAAGANAGKAEVFVRTTNSHIEGFVQTGPTTFTWVDLGQLTAPGVALTPAVVVNGGYTDVIVTRTNGTLWSREALGPFWGAWRALGALPSPAITAPSAYFDGSNISVYVTGVDHTIESARYAPLQAATVGRIASTLVGTLPPVTSTPVAVSAGGLPPTLYATDANGELWKFVYRNKIIVLTGYVATDLGSLMNTTMSTPVVLSSGNAFSVAANGHGGEAVVTATGLNAWVDHMARSRVTYQAHTSALRFGAMGAQMQAGQTANAQVGFLVWAPDWFRVQSTTEGVLMCQAYADGIGWLPEVPANQPCGTSARAVEALRFRLVDGNAGTHVLYRCDAAGWTPWVSDGTPCGRSNLAHIGAIQIAFSDAPAPSVTYRAQSSNVGWQPFGTDGATIGTFGTQLEGLEVASNVGGELRCQPIIQDDGVQDQVQNNFDLCGTVGQGKKLEAFTLMLADGPPGVGVQYRSYVTGSGWGPWCVNGQVSGAAGDRIEAVQVMMTHSP